MTESKPPPPETPQQLGFLGALTEISRTVLGGMPPGLVIIVILFGGMIWFLDNQNTTRAESMQQRTELVAKLLEKCLTAKQ